MSSYPFTLNFKFVSLQVCSSPPPGIHPESKNYKPYPNMSMNVAPTLPYAPKGGKRTPKEALILIKPVGFRSVRLWRTNLKLPS